MDKLWQKRRPPTPLDWDSLPDAGRVEGRRRLGEGGGGIGPGAPPWFENNDLVTNLKKLVFQVLFEVYISSLNATRSLFILVFTVALEMVACNFVRAFSCRFPGFESFGEQYHNFQKRGPYFCEVWNFVAPKPVVGRVIEKPTSYSH